MRGCFPVSGRHGLLRGFTLVFIGTIFLLVNMGILQSVLFRTWWPVLLIAVGALNLVFYFRRAHRGGRPYNDFA